MSKTYYPPPDPFDGMTPEESNEILIRKPVTNVGDISNINKTPKKYYPPPDPFDGMTPEESIESLIRKPVTNVGYVGDISDIIPALFLVGSIAFFILILILSPKLALVYLGFDILIGVQVYYYFNNNYWIPRQLEIDEDNKRIDSERKALHVHVIN